MSNEKEIRPSSFQRFRKNPLGFIGLLIIILAILVGVFAYALMPDNSPNANKMSLELSVKPPGFSTSMLHTPNSEEIPISSYNYSEGELLVAIYPTGEKRTFIIPEAAVKESIDHKTFWLGTDKYGRDLLSRIILGTRISLSVGFIAVLISLILGLFMGAVAGYFGGKLDALISWLINVVWSIPTLLLVIAITLTLGKGYWQVFVAVGMTMWVEVARLVRGQVMGLKQLEYVEAGKVLGYSNFAIIRKLILPNILGYVIVISAANFASAILIEAGLSFLGIGAQPPTPSWGGMIKDHYAYIVMDKAYLALYPGLAIMLLVLAFILVGNALRDALDVKS